MSKPLRFDPFGAPEGTAYMASVPSFATRPVAEKGVPSASRPEIIAPPAVLTRMAPKPFPCGAEEPVVEGSGAKTKVYLPACGAASVTGL